MSTPNKNSGRSHHKISRSHHHKKKGHKMRSRKLSSSSYSQESGFESNSDVSNDSLDSSKSLSNDDERSVDSGICLDDSSSLSDVSENSMENSVNKVDLWSLMKSEMNFSIADCTGRTEKKEVNISILDCVMSKLNVSKKLECTDRKESKKVNLLRLVKSQFKDAEMKKVKSLNDSDTSSGYESNRADTPQKMKLSKKQIKKQVRKNAKRIPFVPESQLVASTLYDVIPEEPIPEIPAQWQAEAEKSFKFPKLSLMQE